MSKKMSHVETHSFSVRNNEWNSGFRIRFSNGYAISVQFGRGNYCDEGETTAEIAVFNPSGNFVHFQCDDVIGHVSSDAVAAIIGVVSTCDGDEPRLAKIIENECLAK